MRPAANEGTKKMAKKVAKAKLVLTAEQKKDLRALAACIKASVGAKKLRERFRAFIDDNEEILRDEEGVVIDGLRISVKVSKRLDVEEED